MQFHACLCLSLNVTQPGGGLAASCAFLVCLTWGRVMEIALWPPLEPLHLYIDVYS